MNWRGNHKTSIAGGEVPLDPSSIEEKAEWKEAERELQHTEKLIRRHMPFLLESKLREKGGVFQAKENWTDHSVRDGSLVTGQNPQSSKSTAEKVVEALEAK